MTGFQIHLYQTAIELMEKFGWSVIAVRGKIPVVSWLQFQTRLPTIQELSQQFKTEGVTGLAVILGKVSQFLSNMDWDELFAYNDWFKQHSVIANSIPTVKTNRGIHQYFTGPSFFVKLPHGEYRGDEKHYTILPPSIHPKSGLPYKWLVELGATLPKIQNPIEYGFIPSIPKFCLNRDKEVSIGINPLDTPKRHRYTPKEGVNSSNTLYFWQPTKKIKWYIQEFLPQRIGERNSRLFDLARAVKGQEIDWDYHKLSCTFSLWWKEAERVVGTKDKEYSFFDFLRAFDDCKKPVVPLDVDKLKSSSFSEITPDIARRYSIKLRELVRVCSYLQKYNGGDKFYLSYEDAGRVMGVGKVSGQKAFQKLVEDGLIRRIAKGSNFTGKASSYCYTPNPTLVGVR